MHNDTMLAKEELTASFARLKQEARSDTDILEWLRAHPEALPDLPASMRPHVKVKCLGNGYPTKEEDSRVVRAVEFQYEATYPKESTLVLEELTEEPLKFMMRGDSVLTRAFVLKVDARKWPYACAVTGYELLRGIRYYSTPDPARVEAAWNDTFPQLPWHTVKGLFATELAPTEYDAFIAWACNSNKAGVDVPMEALPNNLAI